MNGELTLKRIERRNLQLLMHQRNKKEIMRWCRQNKLLSIYDQEKWYEKINTDPSIEMFLIYYNTSFRENYDVGVCGLTSIDHINRRAEFSLYIYPEKQGKGLGQEALKNLFCFGFNSLNLNIIWGETFDKNPAEKLFTKIGMQKEGTRRQFYYKEGQYIDAHLYSVTRDEFFKSF